MIDEAKGYVYLYKRLKDKNFSLQELGAITWFLLNVNWKEEKWFDGSKEILIKPGQIVSSYDKLSKTWGVSIRTSRTTIKTLKNAGFLTSNPTNRYTIFQVQNWTKWQKPVKQSDNQPDKQATSKVTTIESLNLLITESPNGEIGKLVKFLKQDIASVNDPIAYLAVLVDKNGIENIKRLSKENVGFSEWPKYLKYWSK